MVVYEYIYIYICLYIGVEWYQYVANNVWKRNQPTTYHKITMLLGKWCSKPSRSENRGHPIFSQEHLELHPRKTASQGKNMGRPCFIQIPIQHGKINSPQKKGFDPMKLRTLTNTPPPCRVLSQVCGRLCPVKNFDSVGSLQKELQSVLGVQEQENWWDLWARDYSWTIAGWWFGTWI